MSAALAVTPVTSDPCKRSRHHACQLGDQCACLCHTPEGIPKTRPAIEKCETLRDALTLWFQYIEWTYKNREEIDAFTAYMRTTAPKVWANWLDSYAEVLLMRLVAIEGAPKMANRGHDSMSPASVFSAAADDWATGDDRALDFLSVPYVIDGENHKNALSALTHDDLHKPIAEYDTRAKANAMEAAYLRAVQKKLPKDNSLTVGEVFTNKELGALRKAAA